MIAGPAIVNLTADYAGQPVVFVEQHPDYPVGNRLDRYRAANPLPVWRPYILVDSGYGWTYTKSEDADYADYYNEYKALVDAELARPAQAIIEGYSLREGDVLHAYFQATNLAAVTLQSSVNDATASVIVYEDVTAPPDPSAPGLTNHYVRAAPSVPVDAALGQGQTQGFSLSTASLAAYDWAKLHAFAFVDYRPGRSGPYNMLQAAIPTPEGLVSLLTTCSSASIRS